MLLPKRWRSALLLVFTALMIALVLRVFVFEAFQIPSESMEKTLLVGDFVVVSKLAYGPRLPGRFHIPFTDWSIGRHDPGPRLPGFSSPKRGDAVVFNTPAGLAPIETRAPTIKRIAGLPGDTVSIRSGGLYVNDVRAADPETLLHLWEVHLDAEFAMPSAERMNALGITGRVDRTGNRQLVEATREEARRLAREPGVDDVTRLVQPREDARTRFPAAARFGVDEYGPLAIPYADLTIPLTDSTWATYHETIRRDEGVVINRTARGFEKGGVPVDSFTFRQDYLFVLGDNRSASTDSRSWGFVPLPHVIGRATMMYFSWNADRGSPRWDRIFRHVK